MLQNKPGLMPVDMALSTMLAQVTQATSSESVPLLDCLGRIVAQDVFSTLNVPAFTNSAMDGYALYAADVHAGMSIKVVGESLAGHAYTGKVPHGAAIRIMTGAVMPAELDTVVLQENVTLDQGVLTINEKVHQGEHIRQAGEDIVQGQLVLRKGQRIKAADIGLLASLGMAKLTVHQKLTIAVCSTGDELTPPGEELPAGHIYDSNRYVLHAMLQSMAVNIVDLGLLPDDPDAIETVFKEAMTTADVLITSAGVSVGSADYTKQVLDKLGKINFWKVAIKPGKPFAYGHLGKCVFFGLPGNPVAAVVTLEQLVQPVIRRMGGEQYNPMASFIATTQEALRKHPGRADYQRGYYWQQDGVFWVKTTANQSSGVLSSVAEANCFIVLPQDSGNVAAGEKVNVVPFSALLS